MEVDQIYLGDANELIKKVPDKSVDLIVTDPPYETPDYNGKGSGLAVGRKAYREIRDHQLYEGYDLSILNEFVRVMKKINIYLWCSKDQIYKYLDYFVEKRGCNFEILIWAKSNPIPFCGRHFLKDKEYCLYFWETGVQLNTTASNAKTVYLTPLNTADKKLYDHPTIKPLEIIENLIEVSSCGGGLILDPFVGSGTTAVAAKILGRHYIGFEINPGFHQIAIDRLAGVTQRDKETGYVQNKLF